jgi:hypothetical protein
VPSDEINVLLALHATGQQLCTLFKCAVAVVAGSVSILKINGTSAGRFQRIEHEIQTLREDIEREKRREFMRDE